MTNSAAATEQTVLRPAYDPPARAPGIEPSFAMPLLPRHLDVVARCPFVGLEWDRLSTSLLASSDHRCYVDGANSQPALRNQDLFCLSERYQTCATFQQASKVALPATRAPIGRLAGSAAVLASLALFSSALILRFAVL